MIGSQGSRRLGAASTRYHKELSILLGIVFLTGSATAVAQCFNPGEGYSLTYDAGFYYWSPACAFPATNPCTYDTCIPAMGSCTVDGVGYDVLSFKVQNPPPAWYRCGALDPVGAYFPPKRCNEGGIQCGGINTDFIDWYCTDPCDVSGPPAVSCGAIAGSSPCW